MKNGGWIMTLFHSWQHEYDTFHPLHPVPSQKIVFGGPRHCPPAIEQDAPCMVSLM